MKKNLGADGNNLQELARLSKQLNTAFNKTTKIGVFKELHKRGLISDCQLAALTTQQAYHATT